MSTIKKTTPDFKKRLDPIVDSLELSDTQKYIIKKRFIHEVVHYDTKANRTKNTYNGFRFLVTTGSLLIPALMSIQQIEGTSQQFKDNIYWTTWSLSLAVTTCNGFIQLFSLDKNYFTFSIITEKLKTEGWQFLQLSGKYDDYKTHKKAFKNFCNNIETLKIKQVMSEFTSGKASKNKEDKNKKKADDTDSDEEEDKKNKNKNNKDIENNMNMNSGFNKQFMESMANTMGQGKGQGQQGQQGPLMQMGQNMLGQMGQNALSNMGQNALSNMGQNALSNMGQNALSNMGQNALANMGQNALSNMGQTLQDKVQDKIENDMTDIKDKALEQVQDNVQDVNKIVDNITEAINNGSDGSKENP